MSELLALVRKVRASWCEVNSISRQSSKVFVTSQRERAGDESKVKNPKTAEENTKISNLISNPSSSLLFEGLVN